MNGKGFSLKMRVWQNHKKKPLKMRNLFIVIWCLIATVAPTLADNGSIFFPGVGTVRRISTITSHSCVSNSTICVWSFRRISSCKGERIQRRMSFSESSISIGNRLIIEKIISAKNFIFNPFNFSQCSQSLITLLSFPRFDPWVLGFHGNAQF